MRLWQVLCLLLSFWGCKNIFFKTQQATSKQKQTLFDMLIATAPDKKVPYPFSKLVDHLGQYASPVGILIPLGRSLQKTSGYPEPFTDPRRLVGFRSPATVFRASFRVLLNEPEVSHIPASIAEIDVGRRLFMGYVKKAGQIEVISLLPGESEFDFQLVENYHAGSNPVIKTADKTFCRSCHQHGGPIFSPLRWDETNANRGIASLLKNHHPSGFVDGIPVEHEEDALSESNPAFIFDSLVRDANIAIYANALWHKGRGTHCPGGVEDPIKCREVMVRKEFNREFGDFPVADPTNDYASRTVLGLIGNPLPFNLRHFVFSNAEKRLQALRSYPLKKLAKSTIYKLKKSKRLRLRKVREDEIGKARIVQYFLIASNEISGNEIIRKKDLNEFLLLPSLTTVELHHIYDEVERMLVHVHKQDIFKNTRFDPLIKRNNSLTRVLVFHPFLVDVLQNTRHIFSSYKYQQIDEAITKLVADLNSPLHNARLNVVTVVRAILANLGHDLEATKWATDLSPTTTKNFTEEGIYLPDDALGRSLYKHCSSCHGKFSEYNFLHFRTKNEFCQSILSERHKLVQALETGHMPPVELIGTERDEIIKSLKTGSFAFCQ